MTLLAQVINAETGRPSALAYRLLLVAALLLLFPGFFFLPVTDRDEARFAQASKQMIESHDYLDIHFQNETRYRKPVGIYWLQAASAQLFAGQDLNQIWPYRLPSLCAVILAALLMLRFGSRVAAPTTAFFAALLLLLTVTVSAEARLARTDAVMLCCAVVVMLIAARAYTKQTEPLPLGYIIKFWVALGISVLIKGPVVMLLLVLTTLTLWAADKRLTWLRALHPLWGGLLMLAIVLPWLIAIQLQSQGAFLHEAVGHDFIGKLFQGAERGTIPPGMHALLATGTFWPASLFVLAALPAMWQQRSVPLLRFCLAWAIPAWLVLELLPTKLPHYTIPLFPALAVGAAYLWENGLARGRWHTIAVLWWGLATLTLAGLTLGLAVLDAPDTIIPVSAFNVLILCLSYLAIKLSRDPGRADRLLAVCLLAALCFQQALFGWVLPALRSPWLTEQIVAQAKAEPDCSQPRLVTSGYNEPSLVFRLGTSQVAAYDAPMALHQFTKDKCNLLLLQCQEIGSLKQQSFPVALAAAIASVRGYNYNTGEPYQGVLLRHAASSTDLSAFCP